MKKILILTLIMSLLMTGCNIDLNKEITFKKSNTKVEQQEDQEEQEKPLELPDYIADNFKNYVEKNGDYGIYVYFKDKYYEVMSMYISIKNDTRNSYYISLTEHTDVRNTMSGLVFLNRPIIEYHNEELPEDINDKFKRVFNLRADEFESCGREDNGCETQAKELKDRIENLMLVSFKSMEKGINEPPKDLLKMAEEVFGTEVKVKTMYDGEHERIFYLLGENGKEYSIRLTL